MCWFNLTDNPEPGEWKVCGQDQIEISIGTDHFIKTALGYSMCMQGKSTPTITNPPPACELYKDLC